LTTSLVPAQQPTQAPPPMPTIPTFKPDYTDPSRTSCQFMKAANYTQLCGNFLSKYRTMDGSCNNIAKPWLGQAGHEYKRLLAPAYDDGVSSPRGSSGKVNLPNARSVSQSLCNDNSQNDTKWSHLLPIFGQFVSHDVTNLQPLLGTP
jgi:hypothetical protein